MAAVTSPMRALGRISSLPIRSLQRSSFATSSRVTLDFTRPSPSPAAPTTTSTYTVDAPPTAPSYTPPTPSSSPNRASSPLRTPSRSSPASSAARSSLPQDGLTRAQRAAAEAAKVRFAPFNDPDGPTPQLKFSHVLTVHGSKNNMRLTFSDRKGVLFMPISGGTGRNFKKGKRRDYEAGTQATVKALTRMQEIITKWNAQYGPDPTRSRDQQATSVSRMIIKIVIVNSGQRSVGFEAVQGALLGPEGDWVRPYIASVENRTRIPIGGERPRRIKRR